MGYKIFKENHRMGYCSFRRILQGIIQGQQESDYMGCKLFPEYATDKMFSDMAQTDNIRKVLDGDG